jgi:hypothetical protein
VHHLLDNNGPSMDLCRQTVDQLVDYLVDHRMDHLMD